MTEPQIPSQPSRRDFLKTSAATAITATLAHSLLAPRVYAGENNIIKVGLIGCGGRGTGAANQALSADDNCRLVAMGDMFADRLDSSLQTLQKQSEIASKIQMTEETKFVGVNSYKDVIAASDVVLLATPPHFRPAQLRAAIEADRHVFCEKPVAVDAPGVKSVIETCKLAQEKGLSIVSGLCWRYDTGMRETFDQIHGGQIGDITALQCSYHTRGLWYHERQPEWSDMEWQLRNWLYHTWLSGDHINEQAIHSLDKIAWAMGDVPPLSASGSGGRQVRTEAQWGNIYDHFDIVFEYPNGIKGFARCRQQNGADVDVSDHIWGTKGRMDVFKHRAFGLDGKTTWISRAKGGNMYQQEHDELFKAYRESKPINNGDYMTKSTMMAILGRMAAYTGKTITWEQALNSQEDLTPPSYDFGPLPTAPVAMPGVTPFV